MLTLLPKEALRVKKLDSRAILPTKAHVGDLGYDLYACEDVTLNPGVVTKVRTGIACNFPKGFGALLRDRSSVATKKEVFVVAGVIDEGYTGEIIVAFFNPGSPELVMETPALFGSPRPMLRNDGYIRFEAGEKIAQLILTPVCTYPVIEVHQLDETSRGDNGFGSTGR